MMPQRIEPDLLLDFPCHYEFKAFGPAAEDFADAVVAAVSRVVTVSLDATKTRLSSGGRYQSVTVCVHLRNSTQLKEIYAILRQVEGLRYLL
jgi:putative lipoic acid-binding regulatory protein